MRNINLFFKKIIDILGSGIGLIVISPIFLLITVLIKLTSKGPILFKQKRLGHNGEIFEIFKFRTMVVNAENLGTGLFVKTESDDRITRMGKFLRATSLDELPQLWNVFLGDMSLVGPRPPVPHHPYTYQDYGEIQKKRFKMKPGITGLTQVTVRNSVPWDNRLLVDAEYVEKFNVWLDIKILIKTLLKMFIRDSIYTDNNSSTLKK